MLPEIDPFYKEMGERIRTERIKMKVSQEKLAELMGLTRTSVVNFERGRHRPSVYQLIQIGNFLTMDFTKLIPFTYQKDSVLIPEIDVNKAVSGEMLSTEDKNSVLDFISNLAKE